jgi:hypothetical protein
MSAFTGTRIAWAALLLCSPVWLRRAAGEPEPDAVWAVVAPILGVRHLAQAWLERDGRRDRIEIGAGVDAVHAVSALGFGLGARRHRRVAFLDAAVAGAFVFWSLERSRGQ